ncbi:phospholipase A1-Ibeta2, chloroplastic-like [Dendrobium catenatum]|uniref:Phospholipase A1-Ibeta2, chloroplastic n=1 Tax=Dendrobium catenatum TaxID=906689 RepID=A0A2I0VDA2_9ASPA|nr:phospholipase A1-Ibeta2, chloroplastic-like [Dendrobium catenatum]PKU61376.1 Phospholipase A1-Ibeta2, chloroplastic [Dendrobium catenatum]
MIQSLSSAPANQTHLSNLERLLRPHPESQPPQPAPRIRLLPTTLRIPPLHISQSNTEENVSPRSLSHLSQLLSDTSRHSSPRTNIAPRWRDLHGCSDWSGLVDPLDRDLRRELLRYGDFIHSAYHAFFHSTAPQLPDRSYRLTRHLFATSSIRIPSWTSPSSLSSSWIGFVAVCNNEREIRRMGRRDIVIVLRGTATALEWAENLRVNLVPHLNASQAKVECGFHSLYTTPGASKPSLSSAVTEEIRRLVEIYKNEELSITVTGHSLGAALAILIADELNGSAMEASMPPIAVYSFGGPMVGNRAFSERVDERGAKVLRVVNAHDLVTRVPTWFCGGYEHVGTELKVDSKVSPFLKPDANPACCHDLEAYLHLVDGLGGGDGCQFRPNAKRSLVRLISQQRGNVKKLYVNKARALGLELVDEVGLPEAAMLR